MRTNSLRICCSLGLLLVSLGCTTPSTRDSTTIYGQTAAHRVGTFDSRGIALAYGRSARPDCMMAQVAEIRRAHEQAANAGDEDRMQELEAQAVAIQGRIHEQVFSGAPIDEILALIEDDLAKVAEAAGVAFIVGDVLYKSPGVESVDVTLEMCDPFEPDADTRKTIREIMTQPIVGGSQMSHDR